MKNRFRDLMSVCGVVAIVGLLVAAVSPSGGGGGGAGAPTNTLTGNLTQYRIPVASGATNLADGPAYSDAGNTNLHVIGDHTANSLTATGAVAGATANIGSGTFTASASGSTNTTNTVMAGPVALPSTAVQTLMTNSVIQPNAGTVTVIGTNSGPVTLWGQNIANGVTGQVLEIKGSDNTATVTLMDSGTVPTSNVLLPASQLTLGKGGILTLRWVSSMTSWVGVAFSPNALKVSRWSNETVETNLAVLTLTPTNNLVGIGNGSTLVPATKGMVTNAFGLDGDTTKFINGAGNEASPAGGLTNTVPTLLSYSGTNVAMSASQPSGTAGVIQYRLLATNTFLLQNPTGSPIDGQKIELSVAQGGTGSYLIAFDTAYLGSDDLPLVSINLSTTVGKCDRLIFEYCSPSNQWDVIAFTKGFSRGF